MLGLAVALMPSSAVSDLLLSLMSTFGVSDLPFIVDAELPPCSRCR